MTKRIFIIAGPNGAGKTTNALSVLPDLINVYEFLNADEIARGLAPLHPESMSLTASKLMVKRLRDLLVLNKSFAFETTGAGTNFIKYIKEAQDKEYKIHLLYLWLNDVELAVQRVAQRVERGGHHIPETTIRRRYITGIKNVLKYYLPLVDSALILDNSGVVEKQNIIASKNMCEGLEIINKEIWKKLEELADVKNKSV
jgi:predicted ABC-type ATPase